MRKYIISIVCITSGLLLMIGSHFGLPETDYAENSFAEISKDLDKAFSNFVNRTEDLVVQLRRDYPGPIPVSDTLAIREQLNGLMEGAPSLLSIMLVKDNDKLVLRKDGSSLVFALDTTAEIDVVRWQRFEKGKQISSWYESFDESVNDTPWYQELLKKENEIRWFQQERISAASKGRNPSGTFFAGYTFKTNDIVSIVILEYDSQLLFNNLGLKDLREKAALSIMTAGNRELRLQDRDDLSGQGLINEIEVHFNRFEGVPAGNFNFNYDDTVYWNAFKRFSPATGIDHYLISVAEDHLPMNAQSSKKKFFKWAGVALFGLGLVLLALRKRFFYRHNSMEIPSLAEILREDENRYLEFKSSLRWDYKQEKTNPELEKVILKTLAAFGNTDGGILLIGVDDNKQAIGLQQDFQTLKKQDADYYEIHLRNILHKWMGVKYVSKHIRTQFETIDDHKVICKIKVIPADEPLFLKFKNKNGQIEEKFYVRSGNSSHEIESMVEINDYINKKYKR